ncbi:hypothetical protein B0T18DRAFT_417170 [Schizothecium vesticola]|uniref:Uncharacterized protein n=1 Tax=Schizothecium vesticola TaxID=314040 RepID=A0AA40BTG7_9PEZI|nr:hypothetical protein B0T18DRAFT_417170 [Schizothecium vesticola]
MKTSTIFTALNFTLGALASPTPAPVPVSDATTSKYQFQTVVRFSASPYWDATNCLPTAQPSERKYCRNFDYTLSQVWESNGQCNGFYDGTIAIKIEQFDAGRCELLAYDGSNCSGNEYHLGSVGMISIRRGFWGWKLVCKEN